MLGMAANHMFGDIEKFHEPIPEPTSNSNVHPGSSKVNLRFTVLADNAAAN